MPIRLVREGINSSQRINSLSRGAELFYRRLMSVVDDYGRYHASPATLRGACWPTCPDHVSESEVSEWLEECLQVHSKCLADDKHPHPLLFVYESGGCKYLQLSDFRQQTRSASKFPEPAKQLLSIREENVLPRRETKTETKTKCEDGDGDVTRANGIHPEPESYEKSGEEWFEEVYKRHPKKKDRSLASHYLSQLTVLRLEFDRVHLLWCEEWSKDKPQFAPSLAQWILDQGWRYPPGMNGSASSGRSNYPVVPPIVERPGDGPV